MFSEFSQRKIKLQQPAGFIHQPRRKDFTWGESTWKNRTLAGGMADIDISFFLFSLLKSFITMLE